MPGMRGILREMFNHLGVTRILESESSEDAWDLLQSNEVEIDLLIVSGNLPSEMDLLRAVRTSRATRKIPVLLVTDDPEHTRFIEAFQEAQAGFIIKPFNGDELKAKILSILTVD